MRRRDVLKGAGVAPMLQVAGTTAAADASEAFEPLDISRLFNASATDFGPRDPMRSCGGDGLIRTPGGKQQMRGIPFLMGSGDVKKKSWVGLSTRSASWSRPSVEIPVGRKGAFVCLAQFCDWDSNELHPSGADDIERVGQVLAEAVFRYEEGEQVLPIRRRFEVGAPSIPWVRLCRRHVSGRTAGRRCVCRDDERLRVPVHRIGWKPSPPNPILSG